MKDKSSAEAATVPINSALTDTAHISHLKDGVIDFVAGTAGGVATVYTAQPLDTVKVKMQTFPALYGNWVRCLRRTFRAEGVRGLYAGTVPALAANVAENAVLFTSYGFCQKLVARLTGCGSTKEMSPLGNATAGSFAAVFAALVLCPTELVKCKLQAQTELGAGAHKTPTAVCVEMYRSNGLRSFFNGLAPTMAREIPGYFCFFGAYELSRTMLRLDGSAKEEIGIARTALSGAFGGIALWTAIFPVDVVKSRMQITGEQNSTQLFLRIVKQEGVSALYKGLFPTLIRTCFASAALFITYENTKHLLHAI
ncbi:hypothetical protein niasHT_023591 [Heterodera trifolii]|uniref:Mitochondrial ornithine transporter 1 n=1 Tax=Heterodera trifolii TaxID=157864 RepID=A0ABD2JK64_9BILA